MTIVEFRTIESSSRDGDRFLARVPMATVPTPGEIVSVDGNPYIVHDRGYSVRSATVQNDDGASYAYLRVVRYQPHLTEAEATAFYGFAYAAWMLNNNAGLGASEKDAIRAQWLMIDKIAYSYPELAKRFEPLVKRARKYLYEGTKDQEG